MDLKYFNSLLDEQKILLYRLAAYNSYACSFQSITNALKAILPHPIHAVARQNLAMYFKKYFKSDETYYQNMEKAIRGPTILIIDGVYMINFFFGKYIIKFNIWF